MRWLLLLLVPVFVFGGVLASVTSSDDLYVVNLVLDSAEGGLSGYIMNVTANGCEVVATDFPQWAVLKDWSSGVAKAVDLGDAVRPGAVEVPLATFRVRTTEKQALLEISVRIDDDSGRIMFEKVTVPLTSEVTTTSIPQETTTRPITTIATGIITSETWQPPPYTRTYSPIYTPTTQPAEPVSQANMWQIVLWAFIGIAAFLLAYFLSSFMLSRRS